MNLDFANAEELRALIKARTVVTESGCWEWQRYRNPKGYGMTQAGGRNHGTHRVAFVVFRHPFPTSLLICHTCDNPPCCNPDHLFLGTAKTNALDASSKNRLGHDNCRRGERHGLATVSDEMVREAIARYLAGDSQRRIAADLGVSQSSVSHWVNGTTRSGVAA